MELKCPHVESTAYLCDREAAYSVNGVVWCHIHARRLIWRLIPSGKIVTFSGKEMD
jgi:hypothetical protein